MISDKKDAYLSRCGNYRYSLSRGECSNPLVFLMLNPSTADRAINDPTIKRCLGFAEANGFDGIKVFNLYAFRATDPKELKKVADPIGPENNFFLRFLSGWNVVCAWGKNAQQDRVDQVVSMLKNSGTTLLCFGVNKDNSPKHPLYLPKDSKIILWRPKP